MTWWDRLQRWWHTLTKGWEVAIREDGVNADVIPLADLIEHSPSDDCICGPSSAWDPEGWIVYHKALDGRE